MYYSSPTITHQHSSTRDQLSISDQKQGKSWRKAKQKIRSERNHCAFQAPLNLLYNA